MDLDLIQEFVYIEYRKNGYLDEWTVHPFEGNYSKTQRKFDIAELGLIVTEISESIEEIRKKDYQFYDLGIECADIIIRVLNFMSRKNLNAESFIKLKHKQNMKREKLHGKEV
jgi:hypothetical protein